jgi:hypothetical protein
VEFTAVLGAAFLLLTLLALRTSLLTYNNLNFAQPWDHHKYIHMAQGNPFDFHIAPFCWRVVTPLLAKILPFNLEWNFFIIAFLSIMLTGVMVYYIACLLGCSAAPAFVGMLLFFSLGFVTKGTLSDFWLSDPLATLFMTAAIVCILARQDLPFVLLLAVGEGVRESVILVAPLYYTLNARRLIDLRLALRTLLYSVPALAVFVGLRTFIPEMNSHGAYLHTLPRGLRIQSLGKSAYSEKNNVERVVRAPLSHVKHSLPAITYLLRSSLVLLPFLPFLRNRMLALRFAPYALLLYMQTVVIDTTPRYLLPLYPVLAVLAVDGVVAVSQRFHIPVLAFAGLPLLLFLLNLVRVNGGDAPGPLQLACIVLYLGVLVGFSWRRGGLWRLGSVTAN